MNRCSISELMRRSAAERERVVYEGTRRDLLAHLRGEAMRHKSLYHYTQWDNFVKMMTPKSVGRDGEHRVMLLSRADRMNDKTERGWGKHIYFTCFSYSKYEDVAMWMNYGKRSPNAVRVRFDGAAVRDWFLAHKEKKDFVYRVKPRKGGELEFERISPELIESIDFADVAYVIHDKLMNERHCGNIEYGRDFFVVRGVDGGFGWSNDVYDGDPRRTDKALPAFFKKRGWGYERETRLVIRLKNGFKVPERLAIVFDDVFKRFDVVSPDEFNGARCDDPEWRDGYGEESCGNALMKGPWFQDEFSSELKVDSSGLGLRDVRKLSDYRSEIEIIANYKCELPEICQKLKNCMARYEDRDREYVLDEDDKSFLKAVRTDLRSVQKTVEYHQQNPSTLTGDIEPNKYKLERLAAIDVDRLAYLSRYDKYARQYVYILLKFGESMEKKWRIAIDKPTRYGK